MGDCARDPGEGVQSDVTSFRAILRAEKGKGERTIGSKTEKPKNR